jgi:hypothetical protein
MTTLTDYQRQAKRRLKKALKKRYSADFKVRALAGRLVVALAAADAAATRGTTFAGITTFVGDLQAAGLAATVTTALAGSIAGAPALEYTTPVADANNGQVLAADPDLD